MMPHTNLMYIKHSSRGAELILQSSNKSVELSLVELYSFLKGKLSSNSSEGTCQELLTGSPQRLRCHNTVCSTARTRGQKNILCRGHCRRETHYIGSVKGKPFYTTVVMFCLSFLLISTNYDYSSCIWFPCCSAWLTLSSWDHQSKPTSSRTNCINISTLAPLASPCFISWHLVSCQFCYLKNATRLWKQTLETCWAILASSRIPQLEVFDTPTSGPPTFSWPHWRKLNSSAASLKWPAKRIAHERTKQNSITWWVALHLFWGVVQSCISRQPKKTPHKPPRNLVLLVGVKIKMMLHHDLQYYIVTIYFALGITIGIIDCRLSAMLPTKINPILIYPDISLLA